MAKLVFFVVFVAALVAVSVALGESAQNSHMFGWGRQCERELQETSLDACREVVDRQVAGQRTRWRFPRSLRILPPSTATGERMQCCAQLQDVSRECRCAAIRQMVRGFEQKIVTLPGPLEVEEGYDVYQRGETAGQHRPGHGSWYGEHEGSGSSYGETEQQKQASRVSLTKVRQYAAQLPAMCRLEPQDCNVFTSGQY